MNPPTAPVRDVPAPRPAGRQKGMRHWRGAQAHPARVAGCYAGKPALATYGAPCPARARPCPAPRPSGIPSGIAPPASAQGARTEKGRRRASAEPTPVANLARRERPCLKRTLKVRYTRTMTKTETRVAVYARVSTKDKGQDTENQLAQLRDFCSRQRWTIAREYVDHASAKRADNRAQFQALFEDASRRKFDLVLFWSLDRFSREGVLATLQHLQRLNSCGVDWKSFTEQYLDSCGLFKDTVLSILSTIAKQERIRISERTLAGLERARREGKRLGRPKKVKASKCARIARLRAAGFSLSQIAEKIRLSKTSVARVVGVGC